MDDKELSQSYIFNKENIELLISFFLNSNDGIYIVSGEGKLLLANPKSINMLDSSFNELIGSDVRTLIERGIYNGSPSLESVKTKKSVTGLVKTRKGVEIISTSVPVYDENNQLQHVIINSRPLDAMEDFLNEYNSNKKGVDKTKKLTRMICDSPAMKAIIKNAESVSKMDSTVMINGETGTGKGFLAQYIHEMSTRNTGKFVEINCAAIPENLIESELYGYEKGAFTGASTTGKQGLFEIANGGTVFLDEIGEVPLAFQTKLLKFLDSGYILRIGGTVYHKTNVRVICATNKDLGQLIRQGKFREDLFYRLNVFPITMPRLHSRREDIKPLAEQVLTELNDKYGTNKKFSQNTINLFEKYSWPGNIRQLRNMVERIYIISEGSMINLNSLDSISKEDNIYLAENDIGDNIEIHMTNKKTPKKIGLKEYIKAVEDEYIKEVISQCNGSVSEASQILGVHRTALYKKLNKSSQE